MESGVFLFVPDPAELLLPMPLFLVAAMVLLFLRGGMPGVGGTDG